MRGHRRGSGFLFLPSEAEEQNEGNGGQRGEHDDYFRSVLFLEVDWCGPCRMLSSVISEIAETRGDVIVGKVNVDENTELAARFGVMSIPMLIVFKGGKISAQNVGYCDRETIEGML